MKASELEDVTAIRTNLFIDKLTGVGGIPLGYITEIFGDAGIGKSTLCLQIVAAAQKDGLNCLWVDTEWSFTPRYASVLGCKNDEIGLIRERDAESILDITEKELEGDWDVVVLDSVGGLTPRAEIEKGADGKVIGAQAGLLARFCRKIVPVIATNNIAFIAINHSFIDIMSGRIMTSGGRKLDYHKALSIRLKSKSGVVLKQGEKKVGKVVIGEVKKNKLAATEGMEADGQIIFGTGFSASADLLAEAIQRGFVTKRGNTLFFGEEKLGVGQGAARKALESNEELIKTLSTLLTKVDKDKMV